MSRGYRPLPDAPSGPPAPRASPRRVVAGAVLLVTACALLLRSEPASAPSELRVARRVNTTDDADDITVNDTRLRIWRHAHTTHHRSFYASHPNRTWDDDDTTAWDDDALRMDNRSGGVDALNTTYCGMPHSITKNTHSSANASATFDFFVDYLGAFCQSEEECEIGCATCGFAYRAALPRTDVNFTRAETRAWRWEAAGGVNDYSCFGLHAVDARDRPQGPVDFDVVVRAFEAGLANLTALVPLLEHGTVLYADNADVYVSRFAAGGVPFLVVGWWSETGVRLYSVFVHVPHTLGALELVTRHLHERFRGGAGDAAVREAGHARLPDAVMSHANVNLTKDGHGHVLHPVAVSKVTSDMTTVERFYKRVLLAGEMHYKTPNVSHGRFFHLNYGNIAVRFVEARDDATVAWIENVKKATHNASYYSYICGTDRYYDNHFACRSPTPDARARARARVDSSLPPLAPDSPPLNEANMSIGAIASRARDIGSRWHCEKSGIYFWEPTGDTIFVSTAMNFTDETSAAVHLEHDPEVIEEIQVCAANGRSQSSLCGQGYCVDQSLRISGHC